MVRTALFSIALLLTTAAFAQDVRVRVGPTGMTMRVDDQPVASTQISGESYRLDFANNPDGATVMKVVSPEGARVDIWNGKQMVHQDDIPTSFNAQPDTFYRFVIRLPDGRVWEKKLSAKRRSTGTLSVMVPGPVQQVVVEERDERHRHHHRHDEPVVAAVAPMSDADFAALKAAIQNEAFEDQKAAVLGTAAGAAYFTVAQVGQLVDLFTFSDGKVKVVGVTRPRILDLQNSFQLYSHFTFDSDKQKVKKILGQ